MGKSIQEFGFKQPIVVDTENVIVVGHTRWKAAQKIGLSQPTWAATFEAFRSRCAPQSGFPTGGPRERADRKCHAGERRAVKRPKCPVCGSVKLRKYRSIKRSGRRIIAVVGAVSMFPSV